MSDDNTSFYAWRQAQAAIHLGAVLLVGLLLFGPWPLLAAARFEGLWR
jgi:hypothetical protein